MQKSVLNIQGKFGVKILWSYTDMAIFVLRCFILTHPVHIHDQLLACLSVCLWRCALWQLKVLPSCS